MRSWRIQTKAYKGQLLAIKYFSNDLVFNISRTQTKHVKTCGSRECRLHIKWALNRHFLNEYVIEAKV